MSETRPVFWAPQPALPPALHLFQQARLERAFDQQSWDGVTWSNTLVDNAATFTYNFTGYPVEFNNRGTVTERWAKLNHPLWHKKMTRGE